MADQTFLEYFRYRLGRDLGLSLDWFGTNWQERKLFRWGAIGAAVLAVFLVFAWALISRGLPEAEGLRDYETPLPTVVRGIDGEIVHSYARERRVQLQYADFPQTLIEVLSRGGRQDVLQP